MPTHAPEASADYITLHGTHTSVVLEVRPHEAPLWRYWGSLRNQMSKNEITANLNE